jgi:uncharacterized protein YndB with AHSA1/START domain
MTASSAPPGSPASVTLERRIAAPVSLVYAMLIDPEEMREWLGPRDFVVTELEAEVRVGGSFRFRMRKVGGGDYAAHGVYRELVADQSVALTWCWSEAPPGEPLDTSETLVTIVVRADGAATLLTLTHSQLPDETSAESHGSGWSDALAKLTTRIDTQRKDNR